MPDESELDRIDPQPVQVKLSTGYTVEMVRMRTRQFFRLLRVLTHGAGPALMQSGLNFGGDPGEFATKLLTLTIMSIPDAESEAILFLTSMGRPAGLSDKLDNQRSKQEKEADDELWDRHGREMHNPELEDTLEMITVIIQQEAPELQALGKKLQQTMELFQKTGQDKKPPETAASVQEINSRAPSRKRSTSSATSTGGPTTTS